MIIKYIILYLLTIVWLAPAMYYHEHDLCVYDDPSSQSIAWMIATLLLGMIMMGLVVLFGLLVPDQCANLTVLLVFNLVNVFMLSKAIFLLLAIIVSGIIFGVNNLIERLGDLLCKNQ